MRGNKKKSKETNGRIFLKMWTRTGVPILAVTIAALYLFLNYVLLSMELMKGHRVENIHAELTAILSNTDLTDKENVEKKLDLSIYHMAAVLFDPDGREIARSKLYDYTETEGEAHIAKYQELVETMLKMHAGEDIVLGNQINAFGCNDWYALGPVLTTQGEYTLYCAGATSVWLEHKGKLMAMGLGIFAVMAILTLLIAWSCYGIHTRQQAMEAAYSWKVNELAHDLKTPMMVLSGYSENLLADIQAGKSVHYAEKILESVDQMNAIVDEVLEFTRKTHDVPKI